MSETRNLLMEKDSRLNGISQTLGLIVAKTGKNNEDSKVLAELRENIYSLSPEEIDFEKTLEFVKEKFNFYKP